MLTSDTAGRMVEAALSKAAELRVAGSVAVVDGGGNLKAFARMDGSLLASADAARRKAFTAASSGMSTAQWFQMFQGDPTFGAILGHGIDGTLYLPGGEPIMGDGVVDGGIGFSGGDPDQDAEVVGAALGAAS